MSGLKITLPAPCAFILSRLHENGFEAYAVGGCVRDSLLHKTPHDWDITTAAKPEKIIELFSDIPVLETGLKHGTVTLLINHEPYEVTTFRVDGNYTDGRHPDSVAFTADIRDDLARRDLTINAVYADENGNVFDYYNGIEDLENGIIRFIGDANRQIREDYVRILRFFRFYSLFGKAPADAKALKACRDNLNGLKNLPVERIRDELVKILLTPKAAQTLKLMFENDILGYWLTDPPCFDELEKLIRLEEKHGSGTAAVCPFPAGQNAGRKHCRTAEVPQKPKGKPDPAGRSGRRRRGFFVGGEAETGGLPAGQRRLSFPASAAGCGKPRRQNRSG